MRNLFILTLFALTFSFAACKSSTETTGDAVAPAAEAIAPEAAPEAAPTGNADAAPEGGSM